MKAVTRLAATLLIGALPLAAFAQTTDETTEQPATETPAEAPAGDTPAAEGAADGAETPVNTGVNTGLSTGEAVPQAQPQQPQIYVREEHGAFEVRCLRAPEGQEDPCQLFQRLSDQQGNPTADINFFDLPDGSELAGGATILTPLQTLLTAQVTLQIDGGQARRYPYSFCDQGGCYARLGFTEADLNLFRRGANARITVVPAIAPDQPAQLDMSLSGFTAGLAAVEVANPQ